MSTLLLKAGAMDTRGWIRGVLSAIISSFGSAMATSLGSSFVDPEHFNTKHPGEMLELVAFTAGVSALISLGKFLQSQPIPPDVPPNA